MGLLLKAVKRYNRVSRRVSRFIRDANGSFPVTIRNVLFEFAELFLRFLPAKLFWDLLYTISPYQTAICSNSDESDAGRSETISVLKDFGLLRKYDKTLHIGCGYGRIERFFSEYADESYGIDVSSKAIRWAKVYVNRANCIFLQSDGKKLSVLGDNKFDLIYSFIVFQHISKDNFRQYLREINNYLRPRGIFFFQVPLRNDCEKEEGIPLSRFDHHSIRRYSVREVEETLNVYGYRVNKMRICGDDVYFSCSLNA